MAYRGQVFWYPIPSYPTTLFVKGDVQLPMQLILDSPVGSDSVGKLSAIDGEATQVIMCFLAGFSFI
jgi:hypothetical protein